MKQFPLLFLAAAAAVATLGALPAGAQTPVPPAPQATAPAAKAGPVFKTPEEQKAYTDLFTLVQTPATTPDQVDAAETAFATQFPTSEYLSQANTLGMQYFQKQNNYAKELVYGEQAVKADPNNLAVLASLADAIPQHVQETDLDRDQRLTEAEGYDEKALELAQTLGPDFIPGRTLTPDQVTHAKSMVEGGVYGSQARIALDRKQYDVAVPLYQKAIKLDSPSQEAFDLVYLSRAQVGLKKFSDANSSLNQAATLAANNPQLAKAIETEKAKVKAAQSAH